ncbi:MAG: hypothetical protein WAK55_22035 [Xanthobacteraceae bacterium]
MTSRKQIIKGFGDQDPDVESFVKPSNTDYYKHEASGHGYNARWADNYDDARSAVGFSQDDPGFRKSSWTGDRDSVNSDQYPVIDGSQPYNKLLPGGVGLTQRQGVGAGKPRFAAKPPGPQNPRGSRGGV